MEMYVLTLQGKNTNNSKDHIWFQKEIDGVGKLTKVSPRYR